MIFAAGGSILKNKYAMDYERIIAKIRDPRIKVVSFDAFDTLIARPVLKPADIFSLVEQMCAKKGFRENRINAEKIVGNHSNIENIYEELKRSRVYSEKDCDELKKYEMQVEKKLAFKRDSIYETYLEAVKQNKRIIVISDMYLSSDFLGDILGKCGYKEISSVYVSCERNARKDEGQLYDVVLREENVATKEIIHIGDNYFSDYQIPNKKGIEAFYYPSCESMACECEVGGNKLFCEEDFTGLFGRIVFGYAINRVFDGCIREKQNDILSNVDVFSGMIVFPLLFKTILMLLNYGSHNNDYGHIYFVARDGYLPLRIYEKLSENRMSSSYLYASRRAYQYIIYDNPADRLRNEDFFNEYTLEDFIDSIIYDDEKDRCLKAFTKSELETRINLDKEKCISLIESCDVLNENFSKAKKKSTSYYEKCMNDVGDRVLVFDMGYSGSISIALNKITGKRTDKVYVWSNKKNDKRDIENGTVTKVIIDGNRPAWNDKLFETMFSSAEGSCIGFHERDNKIEPVFDDDKADGNSKEILELLQARAIQMCEELWEIGGEYLNYLEFEDDNSVVLNTYRCFNHVNQKDLGILKSIYIKESYTDIGKKTLAYIVSHSNFSYDHFKNKIRSFFTKRC